MTTAEPKLVEAWGVRSEAGRITPCGSWQSAANWAMEWKGAVVPLIAADRLTDGALDDAVRRRMGGSDFEVADVLAALRAHLEDQ